MNNEKEMQAKIEFLKADNENKAHSINYLNQNMIKIKESMDFLTASNEHEVQLRLQFEAKLNSLHALHRDLGAKYQRATEEIFGNEKRLEENGTELGRQKTELIELRTLRIENETKLNYFEEKMKQLQMDLDIKVKHLADQDIKIVSLNDTIEKKDFLIKSNEQTMNSMRLKADAQQALINTLEAEKVHLEISLRENKTLKEQYFNKSEEI